MARYRTQSTKLIEPVQGPIEVDFDSLYVSSRPWADRKVRPKFHYKERTDFPRFIEYLAFGGRRPISWVGTKVRPWLNCTE